MADAGALYGMPIASIELVVLEQREREELIRELAAARDHGDDDEGDGGTRRSLEPVAA